MKSYRGNRLTIAILGRCNTGKSTLLNHLVGQEVAIVSPQPGATGDPVPLSFELLPFGPVTFYDTAGGDESSELGLLRRESGRKILAAADLALVVTDEQGMGEYEEELVSALQDLHTPFLVIFNKSDKHGEAARTGMERCVARGVPCQALSAVSATDPTPLREALLRLAPKKEAALPLVVDLLPEGAPVICVTPIDASAPAGRLIVPQVQVLRELIEHNHPVLTVQPGMLERGLALLQCDPALIITDSQAVREVAAIVPRHVPLTTFSVIFSRNKGGFDASLKGARCIDSLAPGAAILVAEACAHHAQKDDIARVKLSAMLQKYLGHSLDFTYCSGRDFPADLDRFALVLHCGACMLNANEMRRRLQICADSNVSVTNFGMTIALTQGLFDRIHEPFLRSTNHLAASD